ncbi:hypothetical protein [Caulobacter segnis]|uniref:Uncharacterized protein n=1 Tax=Caulobacter segnis TaxID=88688 RepID=A0A2W5V7J5_9CAUL|nr:hypothetical protein [Caulobacter segnis]PZR35790.1 MAG: hypothetical protein DI526_05745 [Caulobacter segnis]
MSQTIDLTPTWRAVLPIIATALTEGTPEGAKLAREELRRMAEAADQWNARMTLVSRYNAALNEQEIAPNGDDYNALLEMLEGGAYRAPVAEGR